MDLSLYLAEADQDGGPKVSSGEIDIFYPKEGHEECFEIEDRSFWFKLRNMYLIWAVQSFPIRGPLVDIDGGNGFVSKFFQDNGYEVLLVEPGAGGIENARRRGVINVMQGSFQKIKFRDNSLPAVGLFDVLEHIENDEAFLTDIYLKLKDDGRLFITVPAFSLLWSAEDLYAGHFRRYRLNQLRSLLENVGFEVEYGSYFFFYLAPLVFLLRSVPSVLGFRRSSLRGSLQRHEHAAHRERSFVKRLFSWFTKFEIFLMNHGRKVPVGSSCLMVTRKVTR